MSVKQLNGGMEFKKKIDWKKTHIKHTVQKRITELKKASSSSFFFFFFSQIENFKRGENNAFLFKALYHLYHL